MSLARHRGPESRTPLLPGCGSPERIAPRSCLTIQLWWGTVVGRPAAATRGSMPPNVSVLLTDVAQLATPRFNGLKTTGLVLGTGALAVLVACMAENCAYIFHEDPS